jgi:hypothetical protein
MTEENIEALNLEERMIIYDTLHSEENKRAFLAKCQTIDKRRAFEQVADWLRIQAARVKAQHMEDPTEAALMLAQALILEECAPIVQNMHPVGETSNPSPPAKNF